MRQLRQAMRDGVPTDTSISTMAQYIDPRVYQTNKVFIEKLQQYLLIAQAKNPKFYQAIITDPEWRPPIGLYTGEYVIPDRHEFYFDDEYGITPVDTPSEYFEDPPFNMNRRPGMTAAEDAQLDQDIAEIMNSFQDNVAIQSQPGWVADHRLPNAFTDLQINQAINMSLPPTPVEMRSRSDSLSSAFNGLSLTSNSPSFFESLRPSIGGNNQTGLHSGLQGTGKYTRRPPQVSNLYRRVTDPSRSRYARRTRFY